ncbi:MAG TPA: PepSY domain-containing protein [Candidatus Flavonifractor merdavium]|nr:PepSY domain-containing protein [Candidatus Flavonifractor merdavium]
MKRNAIYGLCAAAMLMTGLAGCGQQGSQAEYIGIDAAKAIALESAGVSEANASFSTAGLDKQNGMDFYAVDFTANGQSYEYDIDAVTGVVISSVTPQSGNEQVTAGAEASATPAPQTTPVATPAASTPDTANTGAQQNGSTQASAGITESKAKEIALADAGLSSSQVTFIKSKLDWDDGRQVYDVEFYTSDYKEYDYEIDASTGKIISYDYDADSYTPPATSSGNAITADEAKQIALAEVPGATTSDIYEFELDRDDGRLEYEGTIYYGGVEYEFTIDGYSGAIRGWEVDRNGR